VLETVKDQDIAVYAVWLPVLGIDSKASLPLATARFTDTRVQQYWDEKAKLGQSFSPILKADGVAWDVYLLYDRAAEWHDKPPVPVFIMDKIGLPDGKPLDGAELARELNALRNSSQLPRR
jgi:hypothetical protein